MREITKEVKHPVEGEEMTFQITKMNALEASFLLKFVIEKLMPVFSKAQGILGGEVNEDDDAEEIAKERTAKVMQLIPEALASMSEADMNNMMRKCLRSVKALLPVGWQPVMIGNDFGVEALEHDVMTCLLLCYEVIDYNTESFFGGKSLSSLLKAQNT